MTEYIAFDLLTEDQKEEVRVLYMDRNRTTEIDEDFFDRIQWKVFGTEDAEDIRDA